MKFFQPKKKDSSDGSHLRLANGRAVLAVLEAHFSEAIGDLNASLDEPSLKLNVSKPMKMQETTDSGMTEITRLLVRNARYGMSIKALPADIVEAYMIPAAQLTLVPQTEYPSRKKFMLSRQSNNEWTLDGRPVTDNELRMLVLTATNDLLKYSLDGSISPVAGAHIRIGDLSLTTGLRDLLFEKAQLVTELVTQQERLQAQLAGDLHDSVIADLLLLTRELTERSDIPPEQICRSIHEVVGNLRDICSDLSSREIRDWGLAHALEELAQRLSERSGLEIKAAVEPLPEVLAPEAALQIYRIAQECLNNALKHAQCQNISLSASCTRTDLFLTVEDNGKGFSAQSGAKKSSPGGGMGIPLLKERADMLTSMGLQSAISIDSEVGRGTKIVLRVDISALSG